MTELTDLSETDSANTAIGAYTLDGNVANMSEMDNVIQAILGMLARGPNGIGGLISGLTLSNNSTDATNDIDVAAGVAVDSTGVRGMELASPITKRLDAAWAVGTNQGGRMSAAAITDTTYHVFLIKRVDTGVVDVGFDVDPVSPSLPANYTLFRRIGSIVRLSSAILAFYQDGDNFIWKTPKLNLLATNPGTSAVTRTLVVPTGLNPIGNITVQLFDASASGYTALYLSDTTTTDQAASTSGPFSLIIPSNGGTGSLASGQFSILCSSNAQIRSRLSFSDADVSLLIQTNSWVDKRGRG